jgi:hypothetical protein
MSGDAGTEDAVGRCWATSRLRLALAGMVVTRDGVYGHHTPLISLGFAVGGPLAVIEGLRAGGAGGWATAVGVTVLAGWFVARGWWAIDRHGVTVSSTLWRWGRVRHRWGDVSRLEVWDSGHLYQLTSAMVGGQEIMGLSVACRMQRPLRAFAAVADRGLLPATVRVRTFQRPRLPDSRRLWARVEQSGVAAEIVRD